MGLAAGIRVRNWTALFSIHTENIDQLRPELMRIRHIFASYGSAQLHGCRVGKGSEGRKLLQTLADIWQVPVSASKDTQLGGGASTFRFEGSVVTRYPGGRDLESWSRWQTMNHGMVCLAS
jgi:hypothetical protein